MERPVWVQGRDGALAQHPVASSGWPAASGRRMPKARPSPARDSTTTELARWPFVLQIFFKIPFGSFVLPMHQAHSALPGSILSPINALSVCLSIIRFICRLSNPAVHKTT